MRIKAPIRLTSFVLAGLLGSSFGCETKKSESKVEEVRIDKTVITDIVQNEDVVVEKEEEAITPLEQAVEIEELKEEEDHLNIDYYVTALENTTIYDDTNTKSNKLSILVKGESLPFICDLENGWYEIKYDGGSAYVQKDNLEIEASLSFPHKEMIPDINSADEVFFHLESTTVVRATAKVNIRKGQSTKTDKLGQLTKGETLPLIKEHDEWYEVNYGGKSAFVFKEYAKIDKDYTVNHEMYDMVLATRKTPLIDIVTGVEIMNIPKREVAEVYAKTEDYYLVKCNGTVGYMDREYAQSLGDTYVIIDISSQMLRVYVNDKLVIETAIVTGKDSSPTYCGVFAVRTKEQKVHWPEFGVTVKYWMPFNRGEGMHDASWRKKFGGTIYHKDGSHGCVNIPPEVMPKVFDAVDVGTLVLVKK